jgi:hypothetical protein
MLYPEISRMAGPGGMDVGQLLADQLMQAAKVVEEQLDAELNKLEHMDEDEMEALVIILTRHRGGLKKN